MERRQEGSPGAQQGPTQPTPPEVPDHVLIRRIDTGSYGEVWLARNAIGAYRAVKVLYRDRFKEDRPYEREFSGVKTFEPYSRGHEGVVDILQIGRNDREGYFYYVMELADPADPDAGRTSGTGGNGAGPQLGSGGVQPETYVPHTLALEVQRKGRLPVSACVKLGLDLCLALEYLHEHDLVHRDIKPSNILFVKGSAKLADMGLVTETGQAISMVGTLVFMPPEGPGKPQADVFSLGKVLYEISTGNNCENWPQPMTDLASLPDREAWLELNEIMARACAPDPAKRYQSAATMRADLALLLGGQSVIRLRNLERLSKLLLVALPVALGVLLLGFFWRDAWTQRRLVHQQQLLSTIQSMRILTHVSGWRNEAQTLLGEAAAIKIHQEVRNHGAALLAGLDARQFARTSKFGASSVRFDGKGERLLTGDQNQSARLLDEQLNPTQTSTNVGLGPVAFWHGSIAAQLTSSKEGSQLLVSAIDNPEQVFARLTIPEAHHAKGGVSPNLTYMARDASIVAAVLSGPTNRQALCLWETGSGQLLSSSEETIVAMAFSPDNGALAIANADGVVTVRFFGTGARPSATFRNGHAEVRSLALQRVSRIGKEGPLHTWLLAVGDSSGTVRIWDVRNETQVNCNGGNEFYVDALAFSPDGTILAAGGSQPVKLWDTARGVELLEIRTGYGPKGLDFSPDGTRLAVGVTGAYSPDSVQIWELEPGQGTQTLRGFASRFTRVAFSADSKLVAAVSQAWQVGIWSVETGTLLQTIDVPRGETADNAALAFSPDGNRLAFSSGTNATLWDLREGRAVDSWDLVNGLEDVLNFDNSGHLWLARAEREPAEKHWRCRLRDLLNSREEPVQEITDLLAVKGLVIAESGRILVICGVSEANGQRMTNGVAVQIPSGEPLWLIPRTRPQQPTKDPLGMVIAFALPDLEEASLFDSRSGSLKRTTPAVPTCLGPRCRLWTGGNPAGLGNPRGLDLHRLSSDKPLVTLAMDYPMNTGVDAFDRTGESVACGVQYGEVLVFQLREINRRLSELGLGWKEEPAR
jgi:WD40 repeat protein